MMKENIGKKLRKKYKNYKNKEIMSNTEKFYQWMKRINNIYLNDNDRMTRTFHIVANN